MWKDFCLLMQEEHQACVSLDFGAAGFSFGAAGAVLEVDARYFGLERASQLTLKPNFRAP